MTEANVLYQVSKMHKVKATWTDSDSVEHETLIFTNFKVDDNRANQLVDFHSKTVGVEVNGMVSLDVTPPIATVATEG